MGKCKVRRIDATEGKNQVQNRVKREGFPFDGIGGQFYDFCTVSQLILPTREGY